MPGTPEKTFHRLLDLLLAKDMDAVADLWAEDGNAEFPFATRQAPRSLTGREEVRDYLSGYPDIPLATAAAAGTLPDLLETLRLDGAL